ncbi:hypothetical protein [Streptomyces sp. H39-S7]|uniref:hypothetical protein n=1 Tax=Streptomyces sp. H39-S7 TaxID=3004357 RepID=UPI0022AFF309|nr:hypothetical protein [Streptomyces sp. H39-S7]MCZ4125405.1 hypothetical protein [Streptomyces sp. H39-S7]
MDSLHEGPSSMQAAVLPARAVYLIAEGSRSGFIRAVQLASGRWGGMTEPIVPVSVEGTVRAEHVRMVGFADLQAAVNVDVEAEAAKRAAESLELPVLPLEQAYSMATCAPSAVSTPLQQPSFGALSVANLHQPVAHGPADGLLWQIAALGCPSPDAAQISRPSVGGPDVWMMQLGRSSLLEQTIDQFGEYRSLTPGHTPAVVWIAQPDSLADCLDFWNLRALRPVDTVDLPMVLITDEVVHWQMASEQLSHFLKRPGQFSPDVALKTRSLTADAVDAIATALDLVKTTDEFLAGARHPQPALRQPPFTYRTDLDPSEWVLHDREYGVVASFDVHLVAGRATLMRISSSVSFRERGAALLRIFGRPLDGLPQRQEVADLMGVHATWSGRSIQFRVEAAPAWSFQLNIPSLEQATCALLDAVTVKNAPSQPGRLAAALQGRADMRLLLDAGVYEGATALTTPRSHQLQKDLEAAVAAQDAQRADLLDIASRWGGRAERRFQPAQQIPGPRGVAIEALEKLCRIEWAERGLEAPCDQCGITSFHPMAQSGHQPVCPACTAPVTYTHDAGNLSVVYRLNGVVDRAADHGVLPHLLVIAALTRAKPLSYFLPGTDLTFPENETPEVDIFGIWDEQVLAGEVKTSSSEFTTEQLKRDVRLSKRLGADVHLLAAIDTVDPSTVIEARTLCAQAGLKLEVYDKARLRPYTPVAAVTDTEQETFQQLQNSLALLVQALEGNPARAAAKSGLILSTALKPRTPSAGQVDALKSLINRHGAALISPLQAVQQKISELTEADENPDPT